MEAERKRENDMERCVIVACSSHVEVLLRCTAVYSFIYSKSVLHLVFLVGKGNDGMERKALFPQIPVSSGIRHLLKIHEIMLWLPALARNRSF